MNQPETHSSFGHLTPAALEACYSAERAELLSGDPTCLADISHTTALYRQSPGLPTSLGYTAGYVFRAITGQNVQSQEQACAILAALEPALLALMDTCLRAGYNARSALAESVALNQLYSLPDTRKPVLTPLTLDEAQRYLETCPALERSLSVTVQNGGTSFSVECKLTHLNAEALEFEHGSGALVVSLAGATVTLERREGNESLIIELPRGERLRIAEAH